MGDRAGSQRRNSCLEQVPDRVKDKGEEKAPGRAKEEGKARAPGRAKVDGKARAPGRARDAAEKEALAQGPAGPACVHPAASSFPMSGACPAWRSCARSAAQP